MHQKQLNLGIITSPKGEAATVPLSNLASILNDLSDELHVITAGSVSVLHKNELKTIRIHKIRYNTYSNTMAKVINHISVQLKFSYMIIKLARKVDVWFFFLEGHTLLLPVLTAKLLKKKEVFVLAASVIKGAEIHKGIFPKMLVFSENIGFNVSNKIVLYSKNLIHEWGLEKHKRKISIAHRHFVDFTKFMIKKRISERANVVGYIGRFSEEKGILNLVKSISLVLNRRKDVCFVLCGEGELSDEIRKIIQRESLEAYVRLTGWISHADIPNFLNDFKLLVLPSYTEGLPNIMLEAMACGTPVLATQVGAIPDIIKDNETGFLLKSNDPKHITERTVELLNKPELLEKVSINAYNYVRANFSYEKTLETWRRILQEIARVR